jgi:tetratricopeptide (TPR) repeat protein
MVKAAILVAGLGDLLQSLAINDRVIATHSDSSDIELRVHVAWAAVNKGFDLIEGEQNSRAAELYSTLTPQLPPEGAFLEPLSQGLMNWAIALDKLGRHPEEMEVYDRIQDVLEGAVDDRTTRFLAWAFINKGITLASQQRYETAVAMYDVVLRRWWAPTFPVQTPIGIHEAMAAVLRHRAEALRAMGEPEAAVADIDRAVDRYLGAGDSGIEGEIAWAMLTKALVQESLGQRVEALRTCDSLIDRYRRSAGTRVRTALGSARRFREIVQPAD